MKKMIALLAALALLAVPALGLAEGDRGEAAPAGEYIDGNTPLSGFNPSKIRLTRMWRSDISASFFGGTHYVRDSVPKGITVENAILSSCSMVMRLDGPDGKLIRPTRYAVEFISGEPALKDVLYFEVEGSGDEARVRLVFRSDRILVTPGEATFRFTLENDTYFLQEERTLRVVRYEEEPLVRSLKVPVVIRMRPGDGFFIDGNVDNENPENLVFIAATRFLAPPNGRNILLDVKRFQKKYGKTPLSKIKGIQADPEQEDWHYTVMKNGSYDFVMPLFYGDLRLEMPVRICAAEESIAGPESLLPGEEADFTVEGSDQAYTWSLKGDGAKIETKTGHLVMAEDAEPGSRLMITAKPKKGTTLSVNLTVRGPEAEAAP